MRPVLAIFGKNLGIHLNNMLGSTNLAVRWPDRSPATAGFRVWCWVAGSYQLNDFEPVLTAKCNVIEAHMSTSPIN